MDKVICPGRLQWSKADPDRVFTVLRSFCWTTFFHQEFRGRCAASGDLADRQIPGFATTDDTLILSRWSFRSWEATVGLHCGEQISLLRCEVGTLSTDLRGLVGDLGRVSVCVSQFWYHTFFSFKSPVFGGHHTRRSPGLLQSLRT